MFGNRLENGAENERHRDENVKVNGWSNGVTREDQIRNDVSRHKT